MTKLPLLSRLTRSNHEGEVDPRSVVTTSAIAAAWCIVMGLVIIVVPVLLGWAFSSGPAAAFAEALRSTGHIWMAAHHVPVILAGVNVSVLPLGLLVLPVTLLYLAGRWAARAATPTSAADALVFALSTAGAYALFNVIVNAWVSTSSVSSAWWKVLITTGLLGFVTVGMAIAREQKLSLGERVDPRVQLIAKAASIGVVAILALSSLLAAVALGFHLDEVSDSFTLLGTGVVGGLLLTIISLLYLPNIAVWSASFALGPGFLMGTGTQVAASTTQTGALPVFPLVPAIPANGTPPLAAAAVLVIPLVAAMVMGWFVARRTAQDSAEASAGWGAVAGVVAGVALAILAGISGGSLGGGRLSQVGPQVIPVAFFAIFTFGVVAAASAWVVAQQRQRTAD